MPSVPLTIWTHPSIVKYLLRLKIKSHISSQILTPYTVGVCSFTYRALQFQHNSLGSLARAYLYTLHRSKIHYFTVHSSSMYQNLKWATYNKIDIFSQTSTFCLHHKLWIQLNVFESHCFAFHVLMIYQWPCPIYIDNTDDIMILPQKSKSPWAFSLILSCLKLSRSCNILTEVT